jgi:hypothetical protein
MGPGDDTLTAKNKIINTGERAKIPKSEAAISKSRLKNGYI